MGSRTLYAEIEGLEDKPEIGVPDNEDFLPIVRINEGEEPVNAIYSTKSCDTCKKQILDLGEDFDKKLRNYNIPEIVITKSSTSYIPLENIQGYDGWGTQDGDGVLEFKCANSKVKFRLLNESTPKDCNDKTKLYDLKDAELGDKYSLEISHSLERGAKFSIEVWASDDNDGLWGKSDKVVKCGKLNFTVIEQDVFMKDEVDKLINEINQISKYCKLDINKRPKEYQIEYCMHAADRALGKLFENKTIFYTYDDNSGKVINYPKPAFSNAPSRALDFKNLGYVLNIENYDRYSFKEEKKIDEYKNNPTREVFIKPENSVVPIFKKAIDKKIGYHVYYLSTVNGFHTLLLIIDNVDPCNPKYTIYDDFGIAETGGQGSLKDIDKGFSGQSTWLLRWVKGSPRFGYWSGLNTTIAKMKRK